MEYKKITVLVPVYNEEKTILNTICKIKEINFGIDKEIIVIDNKSTDDTSEILRSTKDITVLNYNHIQGRSAALNYGIKYATGDLITFQDADLEIDPHELLKLFNYMCESRCRVVFGARFPGTYRIRNMQYYANKFLSRLANLVYKLELYDLQTCCIIIETGLIKEFNMKSQKWDFSIELASRLTMYGIVPCQTYVEYHPRSLEEGKKLKWYEGIRAICQIFKYKFK